MSVLEVRRPAQVEEAQLETPPENLQHRQGDARSWKLSSRSASNNVALSQDGLSAVHLSGDDMYGVLLGASPLTASPEGYYFELMVDAVRADQIDGLVVGVTTTRPKDLAVLVPGLPEVADAVPSSWCLGFCGLAHCSCEEHRGDFGDIDWRPQHLKIGDHVGVLVTPEGRLCVFENHTLVARSPQPVPTDRPLFGVVDLLGATMGISMIPAAVPPRRSSWDTATDVGRVHPEVGSSSSGQRIDHTAERSISRPFGRASLPNGFAYPRQSNNLGSASARSCPVRSQGSIQAGIALEPESHSQDPYDTRRHDVRVRSARAVEAVQDALVGEDTVLWLADHFGPDASPSNREHDGASICRDGVVQDALVGMDTMIWLEDNCMPIVSSQEMNPDADPLTEALTSVDRLVAAGNNLSSLNTVSHCVVTHAATPASPVKHECPICFLRMKDDRPFGSATVLALPCSHCFHQACIEPWLESHRTCPLCRCSVDEEF